MSVLDFLVEHHIPVGIEIARTDGSSRIRFLESDKPDDIRRELVHAMDAADRDEAVFLAFNPLGHADAGWQRWGGLCL